MSIATELTALSGHITNAYNAVNTKGGTIPANKNMANLDDAILTIPSGGQITNGTVAQYKALSTTVPADTFFEFADAPITTTAVSGGVSLQDDYTAGHLMSSVKLDSTRVCSVFCHEYDFYLVVSSVSSTGVVSYGSAEYIGTMDDPGVWGGHAAPSQVAILDANTVVVFYSGGNRDTGSVYGTVCSISGLKVTSVGARTVISSSCALNGKLGAAGISSSSAIIAYQKSDGLYGVVCTISGSAITVGTETTIATSNYIATFTAKGARKILPLGNNKFFMLVGGNAYAAILTISGTTITVGTPVQLRSGSYGSNILDAAVLTSTKVFALAGVAGSDDDFEYGVVATISGDTMTVTSGNTIYTKNAAFVSVAKLSDTQAIIMGGNHNSTASSIGVRICTLADNTAGFTQTSSLFSVSYTSESDFQSGNLISFSDSLVANFLVATTTSSITHTGSAARVQIVKGPQVIQASQTKIDGVTIDDITSSTAGDVWTFSGDTIYYGDADTRRY